MKKYDLANGKTWLYIEPFVFIFEDSENYLFYNFINYKKIIVRKNNIIDKIVQGLMQFENLYCIEVEDSILKNREVIKFIDILVVNTLGNITDCTYEERPVVFPPKLVLKKSIDKSNENNTDYFDLKILGDIKNIEIQITGKCGFTCEDCGKYNYQLIHCFKSKKELQLLELQNLIMQIKHLNIDTINITGGDIFSMESIFATIDIFSTLNVLKIYNVTHFQLKKDRIQYIFEKDKNAIIRIIVHFVMFNNIIECLDLLSSYHSKILWSFIVRCENELKDCYSVIESYKDLNYEIKPYFDGNNKEFINQYVFVDNKSIERFKVSKREIFANQVINSNYFGSLIIHADGRIYDNVNFSPVGNIDVCFEEIVYRIITEGRSWRLVRDNEICNDCLYKYLCPPPSNLELVMNSKIICQNPRSYEKY